MSESRKVAVDRKQDVARSPDSTGPANPSTGPDTDRTGAYVPEADPGLELPTVPGYELLGILGQGGMGVVYRASQRALKRVVALKMIRAVDTPTADALARFQAEAEAAARVQHANIVQIHEVGNRDGLPYFSLEFCAGGNLESRLNGTRLSPGEAAALLEALARAVQHAHDHGVVHRDLKPANVLLAGEPDAPLPMSVPKIADFGLAKTLDADSGQTRSGAVVGTPNYMAPEQAEGNNRAVGPAADIWALGAILYKCLTGRPPFQGGTVPQTLLLVRDADPIPPRTIRREIPRDLETICLKCLEKDPKQRYASAGGLADDLHRFREYQPILARPVGLIGKAARWVRRRPAVVLGALFLLATIAGGAVGYHYWDRAQENARKKDESDRKARESERRAAEVQAVSVEYFTDIVNRRGLPEGIGPIPEHEARVTEGAFRVHKRGGRIERLEILNDPRGSRLDNSHALLFGLRDSSPRVVATRYVYDEQGRPLREEGLDTWEYVHWVHTYLPGDEARLEVRVNGANVPTLRMRNEWSPDGFPRVVRVIDEQGRPAASPSGVAAIRIETDASGRFTAFETQDEDGRPCPAPVYAPTTTTRLVRDDLGRVAERTVWAADGKPSAQSGVHRTTYSHAPGKVEELSFDADGKPSTTLPHRLVRAYSTGECTESAFAADGGTALIPVAQAHSVTTRYTDRGVEVESLFRDARGRLTNVNGVARHTFTLNENGLPVERQQWMAAPDGTFLLVARQSSRQQLLEERAYTPDGKPTTRPPHGVFRVVYEFAPSGAVAGIAGFDSDGKPAPMTGPGTPRVRSVYDAQSREVERLFLDGDGKPTPGGGGYARSTMTYDDHGRLTDTAWWVVDPAGKFHLADRHNPQNHLLEQASFDPLGRPVPGAGGIHRVKFERDAAGNATDTRHFDVDGRPCGGPSGKPHRIAMKYTTTGKVAEAAYFDAENRPAADPMTGAHRGETTFTFLAQPVEIRFLGTDGKPVNARIEGRVNGKPETLMFARRKDEYTLGGILTESQFYRWTPAGEYRLWQRRDAAQRPLEICHFDDKFNPALHPDHGAHRFTFAYNSAGKVSESAFFDIDGKPVLSKVAGAHRVVDKYDAAGQQTERRFLGTEGELRNSNYGSTAVTAYRYEGDKKIETTFSRLTPAGELVVSKRVNAAGKTLEQAHFDARGVPDTDPKTGVHRIVAKYDDRGNPLELATFGVKGEPALNEVSGVHRIATKYDERGSQIEATVFGTDGKPALGRETGAYRRTYKYDAAGRKVEERLFGTDDKPLVGKAGYQRRTWEYDDKGKLLREKSFDADGKPVGK